MVRKKKKKRKPIDANGLSYDYDDFGDSVGDDFETGWKPYTSVADRQALAVKHAKDLTASGEALTPVVANGRKLAKTFWGQAWCKNLEAHHDYESRLPRGRSYLRGGSVIDLKISPGMVLARVSGSRLYEVEIKLERLMQDKWHDIVGRCAGNIGSVVELLAGNLSSEVMAVIVDENAGLFPSADEISMSCNCPDWAAMCKHIAAVLYGIGARLDESPHLFFTLRGVDHHELISRSSQKLVDDVDIKQIAFDSEELESLFGIEINLG